jgi:hypothetical protein
MVSVLNVGAADASNGKSEATISPRMMKGSEWVWIERRELCLPATSADE